MLIPSILYDKSTQKSPCEFGRPKHLHLTTHSDWLWVQFFIISNQKHYDEWIFLPQVAPINCVEIYDTARALRLHYLALMIEQFTNVLLQEHNLWSTVSALRATPCGLFDIAWTKLATMFVELSRRNEFLELNPDEVVWFLEQDELKTEVRCSLWEIFQNVRFWIPYLWRPRIASLFSNDGEKFLMQPLWLDE